MKIGLLGYGTVGGGVYAQLLDQENLDIKYIMCLEEVNLPGVTATRDLNLILSDPEIDTIIEVMGGEHPAYESAVAALSSGRNFISANKAMISRHLGELTELARKNNCAFRFTAAAGGGIPWLVNLERARRADQITAVSGIVNGTCNYILDMMANHGMGYDEALKNAQGLGYAEANPTADVDGFDTQHKLILSCNIAFDAALTQIDVPTAGIRNITSQDIDEFKTHGLVVRLMMNGRKTDKGVAAFVEPELIPQGQLAAGVPLNNNLITLVGDNAGIQSFYGQGAGRAPTAYNVVQDCIDVKNGVKLYSSSQEKVSVDNGSVCRRYYVSASKKDSFLSSVEDTTWGSAVITKPVPVLEMHQWAKEHDVFFAALPD